MTYHLCAEDMTKTAIVPSLPEEDRDDLINRGRMPRESSAKDRHCVMCPIKRGSPRLLPCCLCYNWCHIGCSYQTHLGRVCPCHVQILDPKRKIIVLRHPYHEDCVVLPTRTTICELIIRALHKRQGAALSQMIRLSLDGVQHRG